LQKVKLFGDAIDAIVARDDSKKNFLVMAYEILRLYKAILPDPLAGEFKPQCVLYEALARKINSANPEADISEVMGKVEEVLDHSIAAQGYVISENRTPVDLSRIDFEKLREKFEKGRKHIEADQLKNAIGNKLQNMVRLNQSRMNFYLKFQEMIDEYNNGSLNIDEFFKRLIDFTMSLNEEEKRNIAEHLSEEELAIFDILTKPDMKLSNKDIQQVKKVARGLLETLKREKLVIDWRKKQQAKAGVRVTIKNILEGLPEIYNEDIYNQKVQIVYQHIYESYYGSGQSVYSHTSPYAN
jgi:type I restriction enzyme, R subunit